MQGEKKEIAVPEECLEALFVLFLPRPDSHNYAGPSERWSVSAVVRVNDIIMPRSHSK